MKYANNSDREQRPRGLPPNRRGPSTRPRRRRADAARAISTDLGTEAGLNAWLLSDEADVACDDYAEAWFREHYFQAELREKEAQNDREAGQ